MKLDMKSDIKWSEWEKWSDRARHIPSALECCECTKRGIYDCTCELDDLNLWLNDVCYDRKFVPPPVKPVNKNGALVMHPAGFIVGPYLGMDWKHYSYFLMDYFHDIVESKDVPEWHRLFFRDMKDFYAGSFGHYYDIFVICNRKLPGKFTRHMALNDVSLGVDLFQNVLPSQTLQTTNFRGKGEMHTVPMPHELHLKHIHKEDFHANDYNYKNKWLSAENVKIIKRSIKLKHRVSKMKKANKKSRKTMHYLPNKCQNFHLWYPKIKQVPIFYDYETHTFQVPHFDTDPKLEIMHDSYIKETVQKWLKRGTIYKMKDNEPKILVTPLVMANLPTLDGKLPDPTKKPRLCHDGGYEKEIEGHPIPCKMEDLPKTLPSIKPKSLLTKLDDQSGFHQVPINRESRPLVVFKFRKMYFTYTVVPFGCPQSPASYQRANSVMTNYGRFFGVSSSIYMDDRICIDTVDSIINGVPKNCFLTSLLCVMGGGFVSLDKSDFEPKTVQEFLGIQIDTNTCEVSVPKEKWDRFEKHLKEILRDMHVSFKELEIIRGKVVSFIITNPMTKLFIRTMNARLKEALKLPNWSNSLKIKIDHELRQELEEWLKFDHLQMKNCFLKDLTLSDTDYIVTYTDASSFALGMNILVKPEIVYSCFLTEEQQQWPIHLKEALAILHMIKNFENLFKNKSLIHFCDNEGVVKSYKGQGSRDEQLTKLIIKIYRHLKIINAHLYMYWCSTTVQKADEPSRTLNYDEEFIPQSIFNNLCEKFQIWPTIDCMATFANSKCAHFISWSPMRNLHESDLNHFGCNFFAQSLRDLEGHVLYLFPPKRLTNKVAAHLSNFYMNFSFMLVFQAIGEYPMSISQLISKGAMIFELEDMHVSIIPAEKRLNFNNQVYMGYWNTRNKNTCVIINNPQ